MNNKRVEVIMRLKRSRPFFTAICICLFGIANLAAQTRRVNLPTGNVKEVKKLTSAGVTQVNNEISSININSQELLFERTESAEIKLSPEVLRAASITRPGEIPGIILPFKFYGIQNDNTIFDLDTIVDMEPIKGLSFSPETLAFQCTLHIGLYDRRHPGDAGPLPHPVEFLITADIEHNPSSIILDHLNLPYAQVSLSTRTPVEPVLVRIRPNFSSDPQIIELSVDRPVLKLEVSPSSISGFGLEAADITILGKDLPLEPGISLTLTTNRGKIEPINIKTNEDGIATSNLRSISLGSAQVRVDSPRFISIEREVRFRFPWLFLVAAILGGLIGSIPKMGKFRLKKVTIGIALGILGGVGYAVGVNVLGFEPSVTIGEAVTFFISGICAYVGKLILPTSS
jgi:hypothetical protein